MAMIPRPVSLTLVAAAVAGVIGILGFHRIDATDGQQPTGPDTSNPSAIVASPSASAATSPDASTSAAGITVTGLAVDGRPVAAGATITITGPAAARRLTGRLHGRPRHGDRLFVITTPLLAPTLAQDSSYVQGQLTLGPGSKWALTIHVARNGTYYPAPDRVTILAATPAVAATLTSYEGQPGHLRPLPRLPWQPLAHISIRKQPRATSSQSGR
jgi:hypothetical protein